VLSLPLSLLDAPGGVTLVIKGLEGLLVGLLGARWLPQGPQRTPVRVAVLTGTVIIGGAEMIGGCFVTEAYLLHLGIGAAASEVPGNIAQGLGRLIVALAIAPALGRVVSRPLTPG